MMSKETKDILLSGIVIIGIVAFGVYTYNKPKEKTKEAVAVNVLEGQGEKIALLSTMTNISYDTASGIIEGYIRSNASEGADVMDYVQKLSGKYNIPSSKISQLIYMYKYNCYKEMKIISEWEQQKEDAEREAYYESQGAN